MSYFIKEVLHLEIQHVSLQIKRGPKEDNYMHRIRKHKSYNHIFSCSSGYDYFSVWSLGKHHPTLHFQAGCSESLWSLLLSLCRQTLSLLYKPRFMGQSFFPQKYINYVLVMHHQMFCLKKRWNPSKPQFFSHVGFGWFCLTLYTHHPFQVSTWLSARHNCQKLKCILNLLFSFCTSKFLLWRHLERGRLRLWNALTYQRSMFQRELPHHLGF